MRAPARCSRTTPKVRIRTDQRRPRRAPTKHGRGRAALFNQQQDHARSGDEATNVEQQTARTRGTCRKVKLATIIAIPQVAPVEVPSLLSPPIVLIASP